jgi:fibronectin type 3 domain-containing protein
MNGVKRNFSRRVKSGLLAVIVTVSIFLPLFYSSNDVFADTTDPAEVAGLAYRVFDGKATITGFTPPYGFDGDLVLPETLGGVTVTKIGHRAFKECKSLTSITISDSVTSIESSAFSGCKNLVGIAIPSSVTSIESSAFSGCKNLVGIAIPSSVTSIGEYCFSGCSNLTSITIPDSVTSIGDAAFYFCTSLTGITIPSSVTSIGVKAFNGCTNLRTITVDGANSKYKSVDGLLLSKYGSTLIRCPEAMPDGIAIPSGVTKIYEGAFRDCGITSITIPDSVTSIGDSAFMDCASLTSITIPDSVTSIGCEAFYHCRNLTSITIPSGVTSIEWSAFSGCQSLTSITIPSAVTSIEGFAFGECKNLNSIVFLGTVTSIDYWAFYTNAKNYSFYVPHGLKSHYEGLLRSLAGITADIIEYSDSLTNLKAVSTGYNCDSIKLTWDAVLGVAGYSIYRSTSPDSDFAYLKDVTTNSFTDTGLTTGTRYYYQIKYFHMSGTTKVFGDVSETVNAKPIPGKPTGLKADSTGYNCDSIKLTWKAVPGATGYLIYRSTSPDSGFTYIKGVQGTRYTNTGLAAGTRYYYKIKSYNLVGTNKVLSSASATVNAAPIPGKPTGFRATIESATEIMLSWDTIPGVTGYSLYWSPSKDIGFRILTASDETSYLYSGCEPGKTYFFKVQTFTLVGGGYYSSTWTTVEATPR